MTAGARSAHVEFCGEIIALESASELTIGREADLVIDENPYLHRRFLHIAHDSEMWWISNVGSVLSATVSDSDGTMQAWLAPGGRLPLVFPRTAVWFTAGPTTYDFEVVVEQPTFHAPAAEAADIGETTIGRCAFTPDQFRLVLALAEPILRRDGVGTASIPSSAAAAARLGWTLTKFNRKLDNVCEKLTRQGVRGLHGRADRLAGNRRARLVEYAVSTRLVSAADLDQLEAGSNDSRDLVR